MQIQWEYQSDSGNFDRYGPGISAKIEAVSLKDDKGSVEWEEQDELYQIHFNKKIESPVGHYTSKSKSVQQTTAGMAEC